MHEILDTFSHQNCYRLIKHLFEYSETTECSSTHVCLTLTKIPSPNNSKKLGASERPIWKSAPKSKTRGCNHFGLKLCIFSKHGLHIKNTPTGKIMNRYNASIHYVRKKKKRPRRKTQFWSRLSPSNLCSNGDKNLIVAAPDSTTKTKTT